MRLQSISGVKHKARRPQLDRQSLRFRPLGKREGGQEFWPLTVFSFQNPSAVLTEVTTEHDSIIFYSHRTSVVLTDFFDLLRLVVVWKKETPVLYYLRLSGIKSGINLYRDSRGALLVRPSM